MKILIDNGHGNNTAGKRSPDGKLREYAYARDIADRIVKALTAQGYDAERIVTEEYDVKMTERCRRVNDICDSVGKDNVLLVSIHCNAAGADGAWHSAHGWSAHVCQNASTKSKRLARCLIAKADEYSLTVRKWSPNVPYWTQRLAICRNTSCAAVLTENLFQDNREDVSFLLSDTGKDTITAIHVDAIVHFLKSR